MRFQFSFKHMDVSPALQNYAEDKVQVLVSKFVTKPIDAHIVFSVERHLHTATMELHGGDGFNLSVAHSCNDMYGSVDRMVDKLATQLKRKKDKMKAHKGRKLHKSAFFDGDLNEFEVDAADIAKYEEARRRHTAS